MSQGCSSDDDKDFHHVRQDCCNNIYIKKIVQHLPMWKLESHKFCAAPDQNSK